MHFGFKDIIYRLLMSVTKIANIAGFVLGKFSLEKKAKQCKLINLSFKYMVQLINNFK